jgi:hypothetical protein
VVEETMKIGVLLDEPKLIPGFDYVFYEVKPSSGRVLDPLAHAWNVVNCFADNTISQTRQDLIATYMGEKAMRGTPKRFLWDWICPSRQEYREYCMKIIRNIARASVAGIRLDSVCFPREGYCDCPNCTESQVKSGKDILAWRSQQIESFVKEVRESVSCSLGLTLEPDPCYGRERFGLDLERVSEYVDFISTPIYMDYSIVYWLDIIANCFRHKVTKPYFIELYAGHPRAPIKHLASALAVASSYSDCVVLSTYQATMTQQLQHEMVTHEGIWQFFEERGCDELLRILENWAKIT